MSITIGTITIVKGDLVPRDDEYRSRQSRQVDGDGGVVVQEAAFTEYFFTAKLKASVRDIETLAAYIKNTLKFSANTVTVIDGYGDSRTMRVWQDKLPRRTVVAGIAEMTLLFREEVT